MDFESISFKEYSALSPPLKTDVPQNIFSQNKNASAFQQQFDLVLDKHPKPHLLPFCSYQTFLFLLIIGRKY